MSFPGSPEGAATTGLDSSPLESSPEVLAGLPPLTEQARAEAREIMARYPEPRSALLPMLHLVQSYQGYVSPQGVAFCAEELGLTMAEVQAVMTFYTMYKRRPTGRHLVSVCTNTLCAVLGGQRIFDALAEDLGVHHDETAADGSVTLEHAECLAACDYAPVVTVDYEFYDQQDVESARELVAALRRGEKPLPTRGAPLTDFKGISRQLAGFSQHPDDATARAAVDAPGEYGPTLVGVRLAEQRGEQAPPMPRARISAPAAGAGRDARQGERVLGRDVKEAAAAAADTAAERSGVAGTRPDAPGADRREPPADRTEAVRPAREEPGRSGQGPGDLPRPGQSNERKA